MPATLDMSLDTALFHLNRGAEQIRLERNHQDESLHERLGILEADAESVAGRTSDLVKELRKKAEAA